MPKNQDRGKGAYYVFYDIADEHGGVGTNSWVDAYHEIQEAWNAVYDHFNEGANEADTEDAGAMLNYLGDVEGAKAFKSREFAGFARNFLGFDPLGEDYQGYSVTLVGIREGK